MYRLVTKNFLIVIFFTLLTQFISDGYAQTHVMNTGLPHGIPQFCQTPTIESVKNGAWSDASTWSLGRTPRDDDKVKIKTGSTVTYDQVSDEKINCIRVEGGLSFQTNSNTRLTVGTILVMEGGTLEVGTASGPVSPSVTAELVIADIPIDTLFDPEQFGTSLITFGKVTMRGSVRAPTFVRLGKEPKKGDTTLTLSQSVSGWRVGDSLVLPNSQQPASNVPPSGTEELTISVIQGNQIILSAPLQFNHDGARDSEGNINFLPHVANLTRNIVIRSANPSGTRGHTLFTNRAEVDIEHVLFEDLGRTTANTLDKTTFDSSGNVTHIGTNQQGRYPFHFHHTFGPKASPADGYQFKAVGNSIVDSRKWPLTVHNSSWGLIKDNVVYDGTGSGIVTEDGNERFNLFEHNFVAKVVGGENADSRGKSGADGDGIWLHTPSNYVRDNVVADVKFNGFTIYMQAFPAFNANDSDPIPAGAFPGADTTDPSQVEMVLPSKSQIVEFARNETYHVSRGINLWVLIEGTSRSTIKDFIAWHYGKEALFNYGADLLTLDGLVVRGDMRNISSSRSLNSSLPAHAYEATRRARGNIVRNADVQGVIIGFSTPRNMAVEHISPGDEMLIENSSVIAHQGIVVKAPASVNDGGDSKLIIRNVKITPLPGQISSNDGPFQSIDMNFISAEPDPDTGTIDDQRDLLADTRVEVYNYNQIPGENLRIFLKEQDPSYVIPVVSKDGIGAPEANLTNEKAWAKYGIALSGGVSTCSTTRPEIGGYVCPLGSASDTTAPAISSIQISGVTESGATVGWITNESAITQVALGIGGVLNILPPIDGKFTTTHTQLLQGLSPNTKYSLEVRSRDGVGNIAFSQLQTFKTVAGFSSNKAPSAQSQSVTTEKDKGVAIKLVGSDPEAAPLIFTIVTKPVNGVLSGSGSSFTYIPKEEFIGDDSFTFQVSDGELKSNIATVSITVKPITSIIPSPTTVPASAANIILTKSADQTIAKAGDTITYTLTYKNTGTASAQSLTITDEIPPGTSYVDGSATDASFKNNLLTWNIASLGLNEEKTLSFKVILNQEDIPQPKPTITPVVVPTVPVPVPTNPAPIGLLPAFPGCEGFGCETKGGRGGKVVFVTNTEDYNPKTESVIPGSLRAALEMAEPRVVVFKVSGTILLKDDIRMREKNSFVTVAGQTVPGDGIALAQRTFWLQDGFHDGVFRHLRFRLGLNSPSEVNDVEVQDDSYNVVFDHCSFSWASDELASGYGDNVKNVNFQWSIFSESRGKGFMFAAPTNPYNFSQGDNSFHHNFVAHNPFRNPKASIGQVRFINNVIYNNTQSDMMFMWRYVSGNNPDAINNYFKEGPNTPNKNKPEKRGNILIKWDEYAVPESAPIKAYLSGNVSVDMQNKTPQWLIDRGVDDQWSLVIAEANAKYEKRLTPLPQAPVPITTQSASQAKDIIVGQVGATKPKRDSVDTRVINEFVTGGGNATIKWGAPADYPTLQTYNVPVDGDADGMSDLWENTNGLNPQNATDALTDQDGDGYTNIEEYMNGL